MAIQLNPQAQQQRQAPFAAFDTTSQFRSGGEAIGRALSQVGQAAAQIGAAQKRRDLQSQKLLASKAYSAYDVELDRLSGEYDAAVASGQTDRINEARDSFNSLKTPDFNSFLSGDEGGTITNTEVLEAYNIRANDKWDKLSNSFARKESNSIISRQSIQFVTESNNSANLLINRYPDGQSASEIGAYLRSNSFEAEDFQTMLEGQPTTELASKFISTEAAVLQGYMTHNLETAKTPEELDERKLVIDEFVTGEGKGYGFDATVFLDAYNDRKKDIDNPKALQDYFKNEYGKVETMVSSLSKMTEGQFAEAERINNILLSTIKPEYLSDTDRKKYNSTVEFLGMLLPPIDEDGNYAGTTSRLDEQARISILYPKDKRPTQEDYYNAIDPDGSLGPTHRAFFSNMVDSRVQTAEQLINAGDIAGFKYLYPEFAQLMDSGNFTGESSAMSYYEKVIKPQMSGQITGITEDKRILDAFGTNVGGNLVSFPEFSINGTGKEVPQVITDVDSAASNVVKVISDNQALGTLAGLHNNASFFAANQDPTTTRSNTIIALTAAATLEGADPQTFASSLINLIKLGEDSRDDNDVTDRVDMLLDHDRSNAMGDLNASQLAQYIQIQKDTGNSVAAQTFESILAGLVDQGKDIKGETLGGRSKWIKSIQDFEDQYITPYIGRVYKAHRGVPVFVDADIARENIDIISDRAVARGFELVGYGREKIAGVMGKPKIDGQSVATYTAASVIIRMAKNGDLNMGAQLADAANYGLRGLSNAALSSPKYEFTPFGGYTRKFGETTGDVVFTAKQGDEFYKALYFGLMDNTYGDSDIEIFRLGSPIFKTEINEAGAAVSKKYYTGEFWDASEKRYVRAAYLDGTPALVSVDEVAGDVAEATKRDINIFRQNLAWTELGNHYNRVATIIREDEEPTE